MSSESKKNPEIYYYYYFIIIILTLALELISIFSNHKQKISKIIFY